MYFHTADFLHVGQDHDCCSNLCRYTCSCRSVMLAMTHDVDLKDRIVHPLILLQ